MNPPSVYELTTPSSQSTNSTTKIVINIESSRVARGVAHARPANIARFVPGYPAGTGTGRVDRSRAMSTAVPSCGTSVPTSAVSGWILAVPRQMCEPFVSADRAQSWGGRDLAGGKPPRAHPSQEEAAVSRS
jgi:hypothetical protein